MPWGGLTTKRDLARLHDLASILIRYGFTDVVGRLGLAPVLERAGRVLPLGQLEELARLPAPVRVRRAIEEMGPTFIKLGQVLSTRVDLLAKEWIEELGRLQSQVPPVPWAEVRQQLVEDLGGAPEEAFAELDQQPLAAASIAQVHRARLRDGTAVALKVRRPGIQQVVEADMRILERVVHLIETRLPEYRALQPAAILQQFKVALTAELDLADECRHAERIAENFKGHEELVVPKVYWEYTSQRMNAQELVEGLSVSNPGALEAAGIDRKFIARRGAQIVLKMLFEDGFFHADPHPGNLFVLPGSRIALIDYGMVGRLSEARREQVMVLLAALIGKDAERATDVLLEWARDSEIDEDKLSSEVDALVDRYCGVALGRLDMTGMLADVTGVLRRHGVVLPSDLSLLLKALLTLEGMARTLDPDFNTVNEAEPFLRRAMLARYSPKAIAEQGLRAAADLAATFPRDMRRLVRAARAGKLKLSVDLNRSEAFAAAGLERSTDRLILGLMASALIVGASIALPFDIGVRVLGLPLLSAIGYLTAAGVGARLVLSARRKRQDK